MKRLIYLAFFVLIIVGCKKTSEQVQEKSRSENIETPTTKAENCIPYFEFDEVEYYSIKIKAEEVWNMDDSGLRFILEDASVKDLSDSLFINDLEKLGFKKDLIHPSNFDNLNDILCKRNYEDYESAECIPIYRDILVLKNQSKISGIVKICFQCSDIIIIGSKEDTSSFSRYEKLNILLSKYRKQ